MKLFFEMAIKKLPNPKQAQEYRIERIWDGQVNSSIGKALVDCSDEGPAVFCVTHVHSGGNGDTVATGRLFSGKIQKGDKLHLVDALTETVVNQVAVDMGSFREEVNSVLSGNLASLVCLVRLRQAKPSLMWHIRQIWFLSKAYATFLNRSSH